MLAEQAADQQICLGEKDATLQSLVLATDRHPLHGFLELFQVAK